VARHAVPRSAVRQMQRSQDFREQVIRGVRPVHALCSKVGIITPRTEVVWKWFGLSSGATAVD